MKLFVIISGVLMLLFGRKLFWFFIALIGFLVAKSFAELIFTNQQQWVTLVFAISAGLLGALLAMFAQRIAFALAGFYAGAYLAFILAQSFGAYSPSIILCIAGGIIGALLSIFLIDWAIIILSCLAGAGAIVRTLNLQHMLAITVFVLLVSAGIFIQAKYKK